jgi:membrane protease YdiL (CAAX protease family)
MWIDILRLLLAFAAIVLFYKLFYRALSDPRIYRALRGLLRRSAYTKTRSLDEVSQVFHLGVTGLAQAVFCVVLAVLLGVELPGVAGPNFSLRLVAYGVVLGVVQVGMSSFLCFCAILMWQRLQPGRVPSTMDEWLSLAKAGWMRQYLKTARHVWWPLAALTILVYISFEEVVFRAVLIDAFRPLGDGLAVVLAGALFVSVQVFHMPSWKSAMFPIVGASLVGLCHGILYLHTGEITPLVVAHAVFFVASIA